MTIDAADIAGIAKRFRYCIEQVDLGLRPPSMQNFPHGACGDATLLLGAFFADLGHSEFEYVCGTRGSISDNSWSSHAWLQCGSLVVDITADQFDDALGPVIVTHDSNWHKTFEIECDPSPADFRVWSGPGSDQLNAIYAVVCGAMNCLSDTADDRGSTAT